MPPSRPTDRLAMPSLQPTKPRKTHQQVYCQIISYGNDGSSVNNVPLLLFFVSRHLDCRSMYIYIYTIIYILYVCVNMWILCILHIDTNVYYNNLIEYIWLHTYILCMYVIYIYIHMHIIHVTTTSRADSAYNHDPARRPWLHGWSNTELQGDQGDGTDGRWKTLKRLGLDHYGSIPINTIFRGMNIHLPAILMFTRGTRFWHTALWQ